MKSLSAQLMLVSSLLIVSQSGGWTMKDSEIPAAAPKDSVMASPQDVQRVLNWAGAAFAMLRDSRFSSRSIARVGSRGARPIGV